MPLLVAAPDKFRGTARAREVAVAAAAGARRAGWTTDEAPLSDGGEGLLEVVAGELRQTAVTGPDGTTVGARWRLDGNRSTAVIEMAEAAGLELAGGPTSNRPVAATTTGVGELVAAAVAAGATRVIVGCGGSATTDGGWGAVSVLAGRVPHGVDLVAAVDVDAAFTEAAVTFGPQKGATPEEVELLTRRLEDLAELYRRRFGIDVTSVPGAGAAGGLAGGLVALGGRVQSGFELVAELAGLRARLARADAVMTGEGRLDATSFAGKVVGGVLHLAPAHVPVICVVGEAEPAAAEALRGARRASSAGAVELVELVVRVGPERARSEVLRLVSEVVQEQLTRGDAGY